MNTNPSHNPRAEMPALGKTNGKGKRFSTNYLEKSMSNRSAPVHQAKGPARIPRGLAAGLGLLAVCCVQSPQALAATYYVRGSCSVSGNGTADTCASSAGGAGAWKTITNAADAPLGGGDVVRIHAGTYTEKWWPKYGGVAGAPLVFETFGDGDVTVNGAGVGLPAYTGMFYVPNSGSTGFVRNINYLTVRGKSNSLLHFVGTGSQALVIYANSDRANGNHFVFDYVRVHNNAGGGLIQGSNLKITNSNFYDNGYAGLWLFGPAQNFEIRKSKFYNNDSNGGNTDGLNIQDASFGLMEDLELYGQYDGLDIGSQKSSPGASFMIVRRVKSYDNNNTNFPNSTTITGPICFQYTQQWGNYNWGSTVSYEGSRNIEYWNSDFDDVLNGVNIVSPASGGRFVVKNNIFRVHKLGSTAPGGAVVADAGAIVEVDYNRSIMGSYDSQSTLGTHNSTGDVAFVNRAGRDYHLTGTNPGVIDGGTFFTETKAAGTNTTSVLTAKDPRTYFWPGDQIEIQGVGVRTVVALSSTAITINSPASFAAGSGVHLPWNGNAPDLGAYEYGTSDNAVPPPPPPTLPAPTGLKIVP